LGLFILVRMTRIDEQDDYFQLFRSPRAYLRRVQTAKRHRRFLESFYKKNQIQILSIGLTLV
jgi:hypothetical protein